MAKKPEVSVDVYSYGTFMDGVWLNSEKKMTKEDYLYSINIWKKIPFSPNIPRKLLKDTKETVTLSEYKIGLESGIYSKSL